MSALAAVPDAFKSMVTACLKDILVTKMFEARRGFQSMTSPPRLVGHGLYDCMAVWPYQCMYAKVFSQGLPLPTGCMACVAVLVYVCMYVWMEFPAL